MSQAPSASAALKPKELARPITPTSKPTKLRVTFLSLPRELRQRILIDAYHPRFTVLRNLSFDLGPYLKFSPYAYWAPRQEFYPVRDAFSNETKLVVRDMKRQANIIKGMHEVLKEDMKFVIKQWLKQIQSFLEEICGRLNMWMGSGRFSISRAELEDEYDYEETKDEESGHEESGDERFEDEESDGETTEDENIDGAESEEEESDDEVFAEFADEGSEDEGSEDEDFDLTSGEEDSGEIADGNDDDAESEDESGGTSETPELAAEEHVMSEAATATGKKHGLNTDEDAEVRAMKVQKTM
ncbi:hypothetical protein FKW77_009198 [Venturia effusa]|uniref:Uncharacterized protein n=1 Tax=Venturia effusa TaxID=50376 RepID=A0A517LCX8_9PEZI|nr:hypothetical protein FKW77_009198 [Venturia effusa]